MSASPDVTNGDSGIGAIAKPIAKYGMAGVTAVLLAIGVWRLHCDDERFSQLMKLQTETNRVIEQNTSAINQLTQLVHDKL